MKSMTGYASAQREFEWGTLSIEMKAVNSRYADIVIKLNREMNPYEDKLRKFLLQTIQRGRVTVHVYCDKSAHAADLNLVFNEQIARQSQALVAQMQQTLGLSQELPLQNYPKFQDFFELNGLDEDKALVTFEDLQAVAEEALAGFEASRALEGQDMYRDLVQRSQSLEDLSKQVEKLVEPCKEHFRKRMEDNMRNMLGDHSLDEGRLLTELGLFADRIDISEELTRFESHLHNLREVLDRQDVIGRRLDFILQELHREVNTLSNKCSDYEISKIAVDMKCELEKMREQVQNIE